MKKYGFLVYSFLFFWIFSPLFLLAQGPAPGPGGVSEPGPIIDNPIAAKSISELLAAVLDIVVQIGLVVIVFFIIFAGFKYVTAQGNTTKISQAHNALMATLIGSAIILGSYAIAKALENTVDQIKEGVVQLEETINFKV